VYAAREDRDASKVTVRADRRFYRVFTIQTETIYRWELGLAWEVVRQIALTRNFLFLAAQSEPSTQGWSRPDADALVALGEWASVVSLVSSGSSSRFGIRTHVRRMD
jgi:hypothetical protein